MSDYYCSIPVSTILLKVILFFWGLRSAYGRHLGVGLRELNFSKKKSCFG